MKRSILFTVFFCFLLQLSSQSLDDVFRQNNSFEKGALYSSPKEHLFEQYSMVFNTLPGSQYWEWDTLTMFQGEVPIQRITRNLNNNFQLILSLLEEKTTQKWDWIKRTAYVYDLSERLTSKTDQSFTNPEWLNTSKESYTYKSSGEIEVILTEHWELTQWMPYSKRVLEYSPSGKEFTNYSYYWNGIAWDPSLKSQRFINESGSDSLIIIGDWNGTDWQNIYRFSHFYDSLGLRVLFVTEIAENGIWFNDSRNLYTYDDNGQQISNVSENWIENEWKPETRSSYTYDLQGNQVSSMLENRINNAWVPSDRLLMFYGNGGLLYGHQNEIWIAGNWEPLQKGTYGFDSWGNSVSGDGWIWQDGIWVRSPGLLMMTYNQSLSWLYINSFDHYETSYISNPQNTIEPDPYQSFLIYPNPAENLICFSDSNTFPFTIEIWDQMGKMCFSRLMDAGSGFIDISALTPGFYNIQMRSSLKTGTCKFIKK